MGLFLAQSQRQLCQLRRGEPSSDPARMTRSPRCLRKKATTRPLRLRLRLRRVVWLEQQPWLLQGQRPLLALVLVLPLLVPRHRHRQPLLPMLVLVLVLLLRRQLCSSSSSSNRCTQAFRCSLTWYASGAM